MYINTYYKLATKVMTFFSKFYEFLIVYFKKNDVLCRKATIIVANS